METTHPSLAAVAVGASVADVEDVLAAWRDAREDAAAAYAAWCRSAVERRRLAYAAFVAAADREAVAERFSLRALAQQ